MKPEDVPDYAAKVRALFKCEKCENPAEPPHTCPYAEEINGDTNTLCTCCNGCAQNCAYEI